MPPTAPISRRPAAARPGPPAAESEAQHAHAALPDDDEAQEAQEAPELTGQSELRALPIGAAQHGARLDQALAALVPELSRSYLQQLLAQGLVALNGAPAPRAAARVKAGDRVLLEIRATLQSQAFKPQAMALDVVYEDAQLLVINKPAGLVVHPAPGNWSATLLNGLLARDERALLLPRAGIVHRLDKDTSGLMVVARERAAMDALVALIGARAVSRQYLALAHRSWSGPAQRAVQAPIGRDPRNRLRMAVVDPARNPGKSARTDVQCLASNAQGCWLRCTLHTGRTHQIRVHLAWLQHPLLGDALYGGRPLAAMQRQALHAHRLAFVHPASGRALQFHARLPQDMAQTLAQWGVDYNFPDGAIG